MFVAVTFAVNSQANSLSVFVILLLKYAFQMTVMTGTNKYKINFTPDYLHTPKVEC